MKNASKTKAILGKNYMDFWPRRELPVRSKYLSECNMPRMLDAAIRATVQRVNHEAMHGNEVVHVRNGVPLTEYGAKLLGVPWPAQKVREPRSRPFTS